MKDEINSTIQPIVMAALVAKDEQAASQSAGDKSEKTAAGTKGSESTKESLGDEESVEGVGDALLDNVREVLEKELPDLPGVTAIYSDNSMREVGDVLNKLGGLSGLGGFKVGYVEREEGGGAILVPGEPPVLLDTKAECCVADYIRVLKI
jgi:hypothetical protein